MILEENLIKDVGIKEINIAMSHKIKEQTIS